MKKKRIFYTELAYLFGLIGIAMGAALMARSDFGVSMVVAPAYLLYLKLSQVLPFFSFGMAEYTLQAVLLVIMVIVLRRFRLSYLFSFVTAVVYGFILDGCVFIASMVPDTSIWWRLGMFLLGEVFCTTGVSLVFHTYISPEVYELFVKEAADKFSFRIHHVKTVYDCTSCAVAIIMSFVFFGLWHFEGVKWGTVIVALINGSIIGMITKGLERVFEFKDGLKLRKYFE